jgi:prolyl-tRNA synthetase
MAYDKQLTPKSENLSEWYNRVVLEAELADYGPAKGTMIFRPYGYAIWELIQQQLDRRIKAKGVDNAYFPSLIPQSLLNKEKQHIKGFSPELAVVTIGGGQKLEEPLVVRPTSETIMYDSYAKWIQSWRDLPLMINQWNNVVRWEKRTYLFMRTSEFLWQEGHTAHATREEAEEMARWGIDTYAEVYQKVLAMPGIIGYKSELERFAGADTTLTYETLMPEGKALQSGTSHELGTNFAESFNIKFQDKDGTSKPVWQTSWGFSTRSIGGLLMMHGDDKGLRLPPNVAPIQAVIVAPRLTDEVVAACGELQKQLAQVGLRVRFDDREGESLGFKINKWELKGVPVRIELGPRELENHQATLVRRDTGEKEQVGLDALADRLLELMRQIQEQLFNEAHRFLHENIRPAESFDQFKQTLDEHKGFILAPWCETNDCETAIKDATKATTRCRELESPALEGVTCVHCDRPAKHSWYFAQAY